MEFGRDLFNAFRKLDILQELLEDESITEIMINGLENIFVEKKGEIYQYEKRFVSRKKLEDIAQQIASGCNRTVNEAEPIVDARLPDGSRVNLVLLPVALNGPIITIRKFPKEGITMKHLIAWGSISREAAEFLEMLVKAKYNMFISGGTGSGKTTFLNALSQFIPEDERIITIEDNAELRLQSLPNLVRLEARNANMEGEGRIDIRELIRTALRMRPDRVIVGEVRSAETIDMLQAKIAGHAVTWGRDTAISGYQVLGMGGLIFLLLAAWGRQKASEALKIRKNRLLQDYPEILEQFSLLIGAGMTVKSAWYKIVDNYQERKDRCGKRPAYEEMVRTCFEMQGGVPEGESYENFGKRCQTQEYMRLGLLLSQNQRKGTRGITELLSLEAIHAFEDRKARAKRKGEETGTKLLVPMIMMLAVVLVIVIVPAFWSTGI